MHAELHRSGIAVTLISPGFISSEIRKVDNRGVLHADAPDPMPDWLRMPADAAARILLRGILRRKREVVVTGHGKLAVLLKRLSPGLVAWVSRRGLRARAEPK